MRGWSSPPALDAATLRGSELWDPCQSTMRPWRAPLARRRNGTHPVRHTPLPPPESWSALPHTAAACACCRCASPLRFILCLRPPNCSRGRVELVWGAGGGGALLAAATTRGPRCRPVCALISSPPPFVASRRRPGSPFAEHGASADGTHGGGGCARGVSAQDQGRAGRRGGAGNNGCYGRVPASGG